MTSIQTFTTSAATREALVAAGYTQKSAVGGKSVMGTWIKGNETVKVGMSLRKGFNPSRFCPLGSNWIYSARF
jgi:hypothetical protein